MVDTTLLLRTVENKIKVQTDSPVTKGEIGAKSYKNALMSGERISAAGSKKVSFNE